MAQKFSTEASLCDWRCFHRGFWIFFHLADNIDIFIIIKNRLLASIDSRSSVRHASWRNFNLTRYVDPAEQAHKLLGSTDKNWFFMRKRKSRKNARTALRSQSIDLSQATINWGVLMAMCNQEQVQDRWNGSWTKKKPKSLFLSGYVFRQNNQTWHGVDVWSLVNHKDSVH